MRSTYPKSLEHLKKYFPYSIIEINKTFQFWIKNYNVPSQDSKISMAFLSLEIVSKFPIAVRGRCYVKIVLIELIVLLADRDVRLMWSFIFTATFGKIVVAG